MTRTRTHDPACSSEAVPSSVVVARSALSPAYCVSLVATPNSHPASDPLASPRLYMRQQQDLLLLDAAAATTSATPRLACLPGATGGGSGYTGSVTQALLVSPQVLLLHAPTSASRAPSSTFGPLTMCPQPPLPSESSVRSVLDAITPRAVLEGMSILRSPGPLPCPCLQTRYELRLSRHEMYDMLVLVLAPPSMLRLLRSEQWIVKSEAVVVKWIREVLSGSSLSTRRILSIEASPRSIKSQNNTYRDGECPPNDLDLLMILPSLIGHSQSAKEIGSAYNILSHLNGLCLASLPRLTIPERRHVDFQVGKLVRRLSLLKSPSGKFGPAISVLSPSATGQSRAGGGMENPGGVARWSMAFQSILEGILRDAEDMAVTIAYQTIRRHFRRLGYHLDAVTIPRLVILDAADDSNIMADRIRPGHPDGERSPDATENTANDDRAGGLDAENHFDGMDGYGENDTEFRVTGLRDWSNCIFGDPLMATVFCEEPSLEFLRGFGGQENGYNKHHHRQHEYEGGGSLSDIYGDDIIEHKTSASIRLLLYQCYHETVAVVKEFYRPQSDSTTREFAARRRLSAVLAKLETVDDDPKRSHVRPSGEMSPAKKPKTNGEVEEKPS